MMRSAYKKNLLLSSALVCVAFALSGAPARADCVQIGTSTNYTCEGVVNHVPINNVWSGTATGDIDRISLERIDIVGVSDVDINVTGNINGQIVSGIKTFDGDNRLSITAGSVDGDYDEYYRTNPRVYIRNDAANGSVATSLNFGGKLVSYRGGIEVMQWATDNKNGDQNVRLDNNIVIKGGDIESRGNAIDIELISQTNGYNKSGGDTNIEIDVGDIKTTNAGTEAIRITSNTTNGSDVSDKDKVLSGNNKTIIKTGNIETDRIGVSISASHAPNDTQVDIKTGDIKADQGFSILAGTSNGKTTSAKIETGDLNVKESGVIHSTAVDEAAASIKTGNINFTEGGVAAFVSADKVSGSIDVKNVEGSSAFKTIRLSNTGKSSSTANINVESMNVGGDAIYVTNSAQKDSNSIADATIKTGRIVSSGDGIDISNSSSGSASITADIGDVVAGGAGVYIYNSASGSGDLDITLGSINSVGTAVEITNYQSNPESKVVVKGTGDIVSQSGNGVVINSTGADIDFYVDRYIKGGGAHAIRLNTYNNAKANLILSAGYEIDGSVRALDRENSTLTLNANEAMTFDLTKIDNSFDAFYNGDGTANIFTNFGILKKTGADTLTLTGRNGRDDADTFREFGIEEGTVQLNGNILQAMNTSIASNAVLSVSGNAAIYGNSAYWGVPVSLTNLGTITMSNGKAGDVFSVIGNYEGNGGTLVLDTVLGGDDSETDLFIVSGDTSGQTFVKINNVGGTGAKTVDGIGIIYVGGVSAGTFNLLGDVVYNGKQTIVVGEYLYALGRGKGVNSGDWFLTSDLRETPVDPEPEVPVDPEPEVPVDPEPEVPVDPEPEVPVDPEPEVPVIPEPEEPSRPVVAPGVPSYEALPQNMLIANSLPTLEQRVGDRYWSSEGKLMIDSGSLSANKSGWWGRIEGEHGDIKSAITTSGTDYTYNKFKMQAGTDMLLYEGDKGILIGGFTMHYVNSVMKTSLRGENGYGSGKINTSGYGAGLTATWYGNNGFYVDGQLQATWYSSDIDAGGRSMASSIKGKGYAASVEVGKRIQLDNGWVVTPQAQLQYSKVKFDPFVDTYGTTVTHNFADSLDGRLGVSIAKETVKRDTKGKVKSRTKVYATANVHHEFKKGSSVRVGETDFNNRRDRTRASVSVGAQKTWGKTKYNENDKYTIYGEARFEKSLSSSSYSAGAFAGLKIKF